MSPAQRIAARCSLSRNLLAHHQLFVIAFADSSVRPRWTMPYGPLVGSFYEAGV